MNQPLSNPRLTEEGVTFTVVVDYAKRDCLITTQALNQLGAFKSGDPNTDVMDTFRAFEANITGVARRLVAAGVAASPVVLRPETFTPPRAR